MRMNEFDRPLVHKSIKHCPFCGGVAYFGAHDSSHKGIRCSDCGIKGISIVLPDYYSKGFKRLRGHMFMQALKHWNLRIDTFYIGEVPCYMERK